MVFSRFRKEQLSVWIYLSELFPFGVRGRRTGLWCDGALRSRIAALVLVFPLMQRTGPTRAFYLFTAVMLVQIVVVLLWYPETKGSALGVLSA